MTSAALSDRCAELRQPMLELIQAGTRASLDPTKTPAFADQIDVIAGILAAGPGAIVEPDYLAWHPVAVATVHRMGEAAKSGDAAEAWELFKDPNIGFFALGQACQGCPGW